RKSVLINRLLDIGTGFGWSPDGFIDVNPGPMGTDMRIFWDFKETKLPQKITKHMDWLKNNTITDCRKRKTKNDIDHLKSRTKLRKDLESIKKLLNKNKKVVSVKEKYIPVRIYKEHSAMCNVPLNAHKSYVMASLELCKDIINHKEETKENKKIAKSIL